ncbi:phosphatidate cytidylyltransferase [Xanthomonas sontii]|uniref:phosphatidate cytidylyltransferase n=1 Tax=Xanthomonas sontii TaxID=2650745 RepID=UPI0014782D1A|nr:phosphatidate cytidylyltransferase [Xanthomonas sontii]MDQ7759803.1 phosphatidate cytidylyltransferase [Xanthomonas sontii]UZK08721.1 phosphatidate cytidylyltransferase [Xanthomonas sontii]
MNPIALSEHLQQSSLRQQTVWLFLGIATVLVVATLIAEALRWRARERPSAVLDNLVARIRAWWVMATVVALAFAFGRLGVIVLFALVSLFALREFITLTPTRRGDYYALLAAFYVVLPWQYWLVWSDWYGLYTLLIPVYAFLVLPILSTIGGDTTRYLERTAKVQWGLMISVFCISHVPALLNLRIPGYEDRNLLLFAFLVIVVQSSDVLQYVWGKLLGRHLIAPKLSPSKTVEGFVGGILSASLLGAALWWITPFSPLQAFALALVANLMGFFGGLVMSAIKRDRGIKDWGHMIEGHGGVLDRLDSVCFAAPVFFHLIRYGWV